MPHSIKSKLLLGAGLLVFIGFAAIIGLNSWLGLQQAEQHVVQQARQQAGSRSNPAPRTLGV